METLVTDTTKLREIMAKATPGDWSIEHKNWEVSSVYAASGPIAECHIDSEADEDTQDRWEPIKEANAELIAAAVNALPALLAKSDRADALEAENARLRAVIVLARDKSRGFICDHGADTDSLPEIDAALLPADAEGE